MSEFGVEVDAEKVEKVINWPKPKNGDEVRQFTAFAGYYRRFVKDFFEDCKTIDRIAPNYMSEKW